MKPTISISKSTNSEIDAAVAEYVAGWRWSKVIDSEFGDKWHLQPKYKESGCLSPNTPWAVHYMVRDSLPEGEEPDLRQVLKFSTDANAVLPLLPSERYGDFWTCDGGYAGCRICIRCAQGGILFEAHAKTFPLAACFALLRAHGVTVTD